MNTYTHNITPENAQKLLIEGSNEKLVVVDFFTVQQEVSRNISALLARLVIEAAGKFTLARINVDEQHQLAAHFGVRSLPTVALFLNGQAVDGFSGEQTELVVREMLNKYLPSAEDEALLQAKQLIEQNEHISAYPLLTQALSTAPQRSDLKFALIICCFATGNNKQAKQLLDSIPLQDKDSQYQSLLAQYELASQAADSPEIQALEAKLQEDPNDNECIVQLAIQYSQSDKKEQALELLFERILMKDLNYKKGEAKQTFIDIIATLPVGDPNAAKYRRKLYTLLY